MYLLIFDEHGKESEKGRERKRERKCGMGLFMDVGESWDLMVVMLRIVAVPVALPTVIENPLVVVVVGLLAVAL